MTYKFMGQPILGQREYSPDWFYGEIYYSEPWAFDLDRKIVFYTGQGEKYSVIDLYSFIKDAFETLDLICYQMPVYAITPHQIDMDNGWSVEEKSIKYLKDGSLKQNGEIYTDFHVVGATPIGVCSQLIVSVETRTTDVIEEDYQEMLRMNRSKDIFVTDKAKLVSYQFCRQNFNGGKIVIPNPLVGLSSLPKKLLEPYYDTDLLGIPY